MITIDLAEREERRKFLNKASKHFDKSIGSHTYTNSGPTKGELCAFRYGEDVIIFRIADEDVELYPNVIKFED